MIISRILLILGLVLAACSTKPAHDSTPPAVVLTSPEDGATEVAVTTRVVVTFDEPMNTEIDEISINGSGIAGAWDAEGKVLTVGPTGTGWPTQTLQAVEVPVTFEDVSRNRLAKAYTFSFVTEAGDPCAADATGPEVISTLTPPPLAIGVDTYRLTFDQAVTIAMTDLTLTGSGAATITDLTEVNPRNFDVVLTGLAAQESYALTAATTISDLCGNALGAAVNVAIVVEDPCALDTEPPTVTSSLGPPAYAPGSATYTLTFDEDVIDVTMADLALTVASGPGLGTLTNATRVDARTYDLSLGGLSDADFYVLEVATTVADLCGNALPDVVSIILAVVDPCVVDTDPPLVTSSDAPPDLPPGSGSYVLQLSESVQPVTAADLSLILASGTGTGQITAITPLSERWFEVSFSGLVHGDIYELTVLTTTADLCGNRLAAPFPISLSVVDPCVGDVAGPVVTSDAAVNLVPGSGFYRLTFGEVVVPVTTADLTLASTSGPGAGTVTTVQTVDGSTCEVNLTGLADTDAYDLTVGTAVADLCGNAMVAPFVAAITVIAPPTPAQCASPSWTEQETFALSSTAPPTGDPGNTNGVGGSALPFSVDHAETTGTAIDATGGSFEIAGLVEHFDPQSLANLHQQSDLFALGNVTNLTGRQLEIVLTVDGTASTTTWGADAGYVELALLDANGYVVGGTIFDGILTAGGTLSQTATWNALELIDGAPTYVAISARPDAAPTSVAEYLDYCINIQSQPFTAPAGGECATSADLTAVTFPHVFTSDFWRDGTTGGSCDAQFDNAVWFHFTPAATDSYAVIATNAALAAFSRLAVFAGSCDVATRTEVGCYAASDPEISAPVPMSGGETYYFMFYTDAESFPMQSPTVYVEPCSTFTATPIAFDPLPGATEVPTNAVLTVTFDTPLDLTQGVVSVSGDGGTNASYDFGDSRGILGVIPSSDGRTLTLVPPVPFNRGEHITVSCTNALTDATCGQNPTGTPSWVFDASTAGWLDLIRGTFDTPTDVAGWGGPPDYSCAGSDPANWVHNTDAVAAGCSDRSSFLGSATDGNYAIADADCCGGAVDAELISPVADCSGFTMIELAYAAGYRDYSTGDSLAVEVSTDGGSVWQPVVSYTADIGATEVYDISAIAAGQSSVVVRFRYVGNNDWFAMIDDVLIRAL